MSTEATDSSPLSMKEKLTGLKDMLEHVDNMIQMPQLQKSFCNEELEKCIEDVLDGSLRLLDMCGNMREVFTHMRTCVQELESAFRKRNVPVNCLVNEIEKYLTARKQVNKIIHHHRSGDFKTNQKDRWGILVTGQEVVTMVDKLKEVESVSFAIFKSLSSFICPDKRSKSSGWSLISKLVQSKGLSCEKEMDNLGSLDGLLNDLIRNKKNFDVIQVKKAQKGSEELESILHDVEEGLERVFRYLIKTRVSLLNILNH